MPKHIKKLVAIQHVQEQEKTHIYPAGHKSIYLIDPETGRYYEPNPGWEVTGENLEELFQEIP